MVKNGNIVEMTDCGFHAHVPEIESRLEALEATVDGLKSQVASGGGPQVVGAISGTYWERSNGRPWPECGCSKQYTDFTNEANNCKTHMGQ